MNGVAGRSRCPTSSRASPSSSRIRSPTPRPTRLPQTNRVKSHVRTRPPPCCILAAMSGELERVYEELRAWCRERGHAGHDPFDALNSRLFRATPLKYSRLARLAWTQAFKRSPVNLRSLALVPEGRNAKGTALFALAALSRFRVTGREDYELEARTLLDELLAARIQTEKGAAWGYNFDWQGGGLSPSAWGGGGGGGRA